MTKSSCRGHEIYYDAAEWRYADNNKIFDDSRACAKCGKHPTKEGHDACLGKIDGVITCCCGHGVENKYVLDR